MSRHNLNLSQSVPTPAEDVPNVDAIDLFRRANLNFLLVRSRRSMDCFVSGTQERIPLRTRGRKRKIV